MSNDRSALYGFRFSATDAVVLVAGTGALVWQEFPLWWMVPVVVGHFFLFCNVFRVRRSYELAWAAVFVVNVGYWLNEGALGWSTSVLCQLPVTLVVLIAELRSPRYHGILARRFNPKLEEYLAWRTGE